MAPGELTNAELREELAAQQTNPADPARQAVVKRELAQRMAGDAAAQAEHFSDWAEQHEQWRAEHGPDTPHEAQLRATLLRLGAEREAARRKELAVGLDVARAALPNLSRAEFDDALRVLSRDPVVALNPDSDQRHMSPEVRAGAIYLGGEPKHLVRVHDVHAEATRRREVAERLTREADDLAGNQP